MVLFLIMFHLILCIYLYTIKNKKRKFKEKDDMPILEDIYNIFYSDKKTKIFATKLIPFIKGSLKFFNNYTNVELNNDLIVADVYELGEENLKYGMYIFTELFWDKTKKDRKIKKAIYLDEIWRLIGVTSNKNVASFIYKIFKTIRKYGGSAVAITQDISDLFSLDNGTYGRSILNNSSIKTFFSLEEENIKILSEYANLSEKEKIEIKSLKRGECLMFVGDNHILAQIEADEFEKEIIIESKDKNVLAEFVKFVSCRLLTLGSEILVMFILVNVLKLNDMISKILVQFIIVVLNYVLSKILVFRNKENK